MQFSFSSSFGKTFTGVLVAFLIPAAAIAQTAPSVHGVITDAQTNAFLPGAEVELEGTPYRATSGSDGAYRLSGVPSGDYTLTVSYVGFEGFETEVSVPGSGGVSLPISLSRAYEIVEELVVRGFRFGQSKALNDQKEAANIKNILSEEQIKAFPDLNTAEVLQRVTGVSVQRSMGEGRFVGLRGTPSVMTNVTVNGQQVAYSNGENRAVELDVISAAQLTGIEVTKVITPQMDADSVGGAINLKTRSAFDRPEALFKTSVGFGDNSISDGTHSRASLDYSNVFGADANVGVSLGLNYASTAAERHSNEQKWGSRDTVDDVEIPYALRNSEVLFSENQRDRYGLNTRFEFRLNENHQVYFSAVYNYREDDQDRQITRIRWDKGDYISRTQVEGLRIIKSLHDRLEEQKITTYAFGGEHQGDGSRFDYSVSRSSAFTKKPEGQLKPEFQAKGLDLNILGIDSKAPSWDSSRQDIHNSDIFEFDSVDVKYESTTSEIDSAAVNFTMPMLFGSDSGEFKVGAKVRALHKERADQRSRMKWKGDDDLILSRFENNATRILESGYNLGNEYQREDFRSFLFGNQGPGGFVEQARNDVNLGEPYDAEENVKGVYAMTLQNYGKLLVLAGLRVELNKQDYTGANLVVNDDGVISLAQDSVDRDFNEVFPNLQFRYRARPDTNVRIAYTRSMARPNFWAAMPYSYTHLDDEEIVRGNPHLEPAISDNFDFLVERFFDRVGVISAGLFFKRLEDFTFRVETSQVGGPYDGFDVEDSANGGSADLWGMEITWQQQFSDLPGWMSGLGIYANYTFTGVTSIDFGPSTDRDDIDVLPEQMKNVGNVALIYEKGNIVSRLAVNLSGKWLSEVAGSADFDEWTDGATTVDVAFTYHFNNGVEVFFQGNNLTEEIEYLYLGSTTRARQHHIFGRTLNIGAQWAF